MNLNMQFMEEISKIQDPQIFLGIARLLKVKLVDAGVDGARGMDSQDLKDEKVEARDFVDLFKDVMSAYSARDRKFKRELLKILRKANKQVGEANGSNTKDS